MTINLYTDVNRKLTIAILFIPMIICCTSLHANTTTADADSIVRNVLDSLSIYTPEPHVIKNRLDFVKLYEDKVQDPMILGEYYRQCGHYEQDYGSTAVAHINLQQAIKYFQQVDNEISAYWQAECLVAIATEYYSLMDTTGLSNIVENICRLYNRYHTKLIAYQYHHAYYHMMDCKYRYSQQREHRNELFNHLYSAITATRNMTGRQLIEYNINPAWDYYNLASGYDVFTDPKQIDSINKYINLCEKYIPFSHVKSDSSNLVYHVENERVWVQYYQHNYDSVESGLNRLLDMLANDRFLLYRDLVLNQQQLYLFIKEYNCAIGNYRVAYKYQQMQYEEEHKIFDIEKMKAISNIEIQFDVERKEQEILRLQQQNEVNKRNYIIIIIAIVFALIVMILAVVIQRAISKNHEQQLYEAAIEAELQKESRNMNLKQVYKRMLTDFPKYEKKLNAMDFEGIQKIIDQATTPLTTMDLQYIIVFQGLNMKPAQVAEMFNVEPASVYTVRYRIRKKFPEGVFS